MYCGLHKGTELLGFTQGIAPLSMQAFLEKLSCFFYLVDIEEFVNLSVPHKNKITSNHTSKQKHNMLVLANAAWMNIFRPFL